MSKDWFAAATWPLEAAVVWIATGNKTLASGAARLALRRRDYPKEKLPSLGIWLVIREGLARELESVDGALYREEMRQDWAPGLLNQGHPIEQAIKSVHLLLRGTHITGQRSNSQRVPISGKLWNSLILVDDRQHGLIARHRKNSDDPPWRCIEVSAAVVRKLKTKRGRRPAGLSGTPRAASYSLKTEQRLKRKKVRADDQ